MNLDPELQQPLCDLLRALGGGIDLHDLSDMRARLNRVCEAPPLPAPFACHSLCCMDTTVDLREYRASVFSTPPSDGSEPVLIWFHGGGYVMGRAQHDDGLCQRFANQLGIRVFSLDYPLAPEFPYPHALVAATCAWDWVLNTFDNCGKSPRMAIGGASAGAGLAASLALWLRDRAQIQPQPTVQPCLQWLMYPMLDVQTSTQHDTGADPAVPDALLWTHDCNRQAWNYVLSQAQNPRVSWAPVFKALTAHPYYSPSQMKDLAGLPPAFIAVGDLDLFYNENRVYAERLRQARVACEFHTLPHAPHAPDAFAPHSIVAQSLDHLRMKALRQALWRTVP